MMPTLAEPATAAPWQVRLNFSTGQTLYEVLHHTHPSLVLDRRYWADGDTGPTDADGYLLHDEHADVGEHRVRLGWMLVAAPAMQEALRGVLAAATSDEMADALDQARDALALANMPTLAPRPPAGADVEAYSLVPAAGGDGPDARRSPGTVAEAAALLAEFGPRRFILWALAFGPDVADVEASWDPAAGRWTPWRPVAATE